MSIETPEEAREILRKLGPEWLRLLDHMSMSPECEAAVADVEREIVGLRTAEAELASLRAGVPLTPTPDPSVTGAISLRQGVRLMHALGVARGRLSNAEKLAKRLEDLACQSESYTQCEHGRFLHEGVPAVMLALSRELAATADEPGLPEINLGPEDAARVLEAIDNPAEPTPALRKLMAPTARQPYRVDPTRLDHPPTGIYVRATDGEAWDSHDVATLDRDSLARWLRQGEGLADRCLLLLLGHEQP